MVIMGPPINTWPYNIPTYTRDEERSSSHDSFMKCVVLRAVDNFRQLCCHLTIVLVILQVLYSLNSVAAGPVILNLDYMQGPVPLARNIRHLPCISRRTAQEGLCMFAIDCLKANGTHLGTCIDRFYFGSCCQIPDKTILPHIIGNNIEDNSIDSSSFVHPQTEDKIHSTVNKLPNLFSTKRPTTVKVETTTRRQTSQTIQEKYDTESPEMKTDDVTTLNNKISTDDETFKVTPALVIETTTRKQTVATTTKIAEVTTEIPIKLSTFQTISGDNSLITAKPTQNIENEYSSNSTSQITTTSTTYKPPTRKPTYKPRPSYKPSNFTRPTYGLTTRKPFPTKPISTIYNSTRKPPYRPPPKRPSTRKPLPSPPRLNITILPQSTSSRPVFTRPLTPIITYINNTATTVEEKPSTTFSTALPTVTTTTTELPTTTTTSKPTTTEKVTETLPLTTMILTSSSTSTESITESTEKIIPTTDASINTVESLVESPVEPVRETVVTTEIVPEKETVKPTETEANEVTETSTLPTTLSSSDEPLTTLPVTTLSSSTSTTPPSTTQPSSTTPLPSTTAPSTFPPLVTWSNNVDTATKAPEKPTTVTEDETWSPITPPDGWILISTVPPKPETTITTSTTTEEPRTTESLTTKTQPTTIAVTEPEPTQSVPETTMIATETLETDNPTTISEPLTTAESTQPTTPVVVSTQPLTTSTAQTIPETTEPSVMEFVVNVTMSPPVQTTTVSGLFTSTSENITAVNQTESTTGTVNATTAAPSEAGLTSTANPLNVTSPSSSITSGFTTTEPVNMSDYKDVCGRRLWPQGRIVGGAKSGFGQWPWQISLRQYRTSTYLHKCGAALLNENWAITAAHCVEHVPPSELLVRLGEHDLANEDEPYGFAERRVQIVASHPHFDPATFEYDLALLRFYEPVTFQPNILPVCVPDTDEDFVGKTAHVTGWGRLYDEGPLPSVLQEVQVPVINNTACEAMYQAAGYNEHIPNIFICAGWRKGGSDSCEGDSGGPMVIQRDRDKRFVLGGVISWGIGCAEPNQPGVYTRISEFRDWINQILQF